jgi:hypothetical protein
MIRNIYIKLLLPPCMLCIFCLAACNDDNNNVDITKYSVSSDFKTITAIVPNNIIDNGYLVVKYYSSIACTSFRRKLL